MGARPISLALPRHAQRKPDLPRAKAAAARSNDSRSIGSADRPQKQQCPAFYRRACRDAILDGNLHHTGVMLSGISMPAVGEVSG
jgi:hypothetical protein